MPAREAVIVATRDLSIVPHLHAQVQDIDVAGCQAELPALAEGPQYWCFVDWLLPDISGIEMCRRLRETPATRYAHITMILDGDDSESKQRALRSGADDYLAGPADADRLAARLQAYRRSRGGSPPTVRLKSGDLQVDLAAILVRYGDRRISLAPNEFRLLAHFVENPDRVYSRSSLIELLAKDDAGIDCRTVDVWVGRLRRALKAHGVPDRLRTVRAMGYVFDGF
ncbi:MAG: winged helix-turn-helix domain-containing protein [Sphingomonadales bacterium]|jgi:two-component system phosphate regulon response regulator PhoB|nr:winged helix-turn-helix domain-containing protein [Sphingomonadales bacterium]MBK9003429.1 winged helix-turn-helix domain-containing protein [Sphingomonadales bacterium]MBK9268589.1 winged helix-turn-helix domain-containing protein [Sphingomonadales bacterium]MBP6434119.1 winged helix-turn-helix domain-containing protein [Sphingorhabdus sp.]